jgi:hypothetical protein
MPGKYIDKGEEIVKVQVKSRKDKPIGPNDFFKKNC